MLLLAVFLAVLQLALVLHARNVLVASAAEGARFAANADRTPAEGAARTHDLVAEALSSQLAGQLHISAAQITGDAAVPLVEVTVHGPLPLVLLPAGALTVTVRGHALEEAP